MDRWTISTSSFRWPNIRPSPSFVRSPTRIGPWAGPLRHFLFNDLPNNSVRHFADGCVLYRHIFSLTDCETLQVDLDNLAQWESDWQIKFNMAKYHSMRVTRHSLLMQIKYSYILHNQSCPPNFWE